MPFHVGNSLLKINPSLEGAPGVVIINNKKDKNSAALVWLCFYIIEVV